MMMNNNVKIICKILGQNVRHYRLKQGFDVKKLSEISQIRRNYIYKIERGLAFGIKISQIFSIAKALHVEAKKLMEEMY